MRERIIHGLCRGKQSTWLSANRAKKAGEPAPLKIYNNTR